MAFTKDNLPISAYFGFKDDVFRLFISQLICYLLGIVYNLFLVKQSVKIKHLCNITFGLLIYYYNFGIDFGHSLATCLVTWSIIRLLGPTRTMVALNFVFALGTLLYGYFDKEWYHTPYFTWTLPQCVLTLSLIALSFDVYDGHRNVIARAKGGVLVNEDSALERIPSLMEILSKVFFPPTFLIGPQVKFRDFLQFTNSTENLLAFCWRQSLLRLGAGVLFFGCYQAGQTYFTSHYFISAQFASHGVIAKLTLLAIYNKSVLYKYISGWLITEGACIMYGISRDPTTGLITRCFNMSILHYETTVTFGGLIESFNMSTNQFAMRYIFKRLKFLKSKLASQFGTLFFLALWHGYALGYYNTFALEMAIMKMEKDITTMVIRYRTRNQSVNQLLNQSWVRAVIYILMRLHVLYMFSYAFTSFGFLEVSQWTHILAEVYYIGHIIYFSWIVISIVIGL